MGKSFDFWEQTILKKKKEQQIVSKEFSRLATTTQIS